MSLYSLHEEYASWSAFSLEMTVHSFSCNESGGGFSEIIWHTASCVSNLRSICSFIGVSNMIFPFELDLLWLIFFKKKNSDCTLLMLLAL